jgi:hypothetical protein
LRNEEADFQPALLGEYSSATDNLNIAQLRKLLTETASEIASFK